MSKKRKAIPLYVKDLVIFKQNNKCNICLSLLQKTKEGVKLFDIDHIQMHCIKQNNCVTNLQALCLDCHRTKTVLERRQMRSTKNQDEKIVNFEAKEIGENNRFKKFAFT